MSFNVETSKKENYIIIKVKGAYTGEDFDKKLVDFFYNLEEIIKKYDCLNVLLDITDLEYNINDTERYRIGRMHEKVYKKYFIKIACLRTKNIIDDFTEIVAHNYGAMFRFFSDRKKAIAWLKEKN